MTKTSATPHPAIAAIILLLWLSMGPVVGSALSFVNAMPTHLPALAYFAVSPVEWRVVFFLAGCLAVASAWLVHKRHYRYALGTSILFAALYLPAFPVVWGQRSVGMASAIAAVVLVGYLCVALRRDEA
jgi:hypothetical protein